jgi:hypothetical protein
MPPTNVLNAITEKADLSPVKKGWVGDKPCLVTVDTGVYVTVASMTWPPDDLKDSQTNATC